MTHHDFEELLFRHLESGDLDSEHAVTLHEHLESCKDCSSLAAAWHSLDHQLNKKRLVEPKAGFTVRWYARLDREHLLLQRRQTLAFAIFTIGGSMILFSSLILLALPWLGTPKVLLWSGIYQLASLINNLEPVARMFSVIMGSISGRISPLGWILYAGLLSEVAVLWLVSYRMLTNPRRVSR